MEPLVDLFGGEAEGENQTRLPPEVEEGNVEYKLKLLSPTPSRFEHLVTQMKWRLQEGRGEAIYQIGVADCGALRGLDRAEMDASLDTLEKMAQRLGASLTTLRRRTVLTATSEQRWVQEVLIRKVPDDQQFLDIRLAVLGNMEAGKSTLLGVLTQGELDNGRGRARLNLFRHLHEIQSGRTSSISHEIMGFTSQGEVVNYLSHGSAEEICKASAKLITFIDLAGHHKYLKTTVFGLTTRRPDFSMLVVGANAGVAGTTCEHLSFSIALKVPTFVVVSKTDLCDDPGTKEVVHQLRDLLVLPGCSKIPVLIQSDNDVYSTAQHFTENSICPIFLVSSVTGQGLDLLRKFLNTIPKNLHQQQDLEQQLAEFRVDEIYSVPEVGTVVGGLLTHGIISEGDELLVGPRNDCLFSLTKVVSIHRFRSPCRLVKAMQSATLALKEVERTDIRKGTVLLSCSYQQTEESRSCWKFTADIFLLHHNGSSLRQATVFVASTMQAATIHTEEEHEQWVMGRKARVHFQFLKHPEFLRVGWRLLFREGQTHGIGEITSLLPADGTRSLPTSPSPDR